MNRMQLAGIGILGGVVTIIGAIGAWATYHGVSLAGTDANRGKTVAIAAGVGLLLLALSAWKNLRWVSVLAAIAGLVSFGLTIWSLSSINKFAGVPAGIPIGRGWGIWLSTIGSIVLVLAALAATFMKSEPVPIDPQPGPGPEPAA